MDQLLEMFATAYRNKLAAVAFERTLWDETMARPWLRHHGFKDKNMTTTPGWISFEQGQAEGREVFEVILSPGPGLVLGVVNGAHRIMTLRHWRRLTLDQLAEHDWPLAESPSMDDFNPPTEVLPW